MNAGGLVLLREPRFIRLLYSGFCVPLFIAGAPGQVGGQLSKTFTHVNDLVPTLLQGAGIPAHDGNYQGRQVEPMDGRSLLAQMQGKTAKVYGPTEAVGYELSGCQAVFKGAYKLIKNIPPLGDRQWHLYDPEKNPGEANDLAATRPELVKEMQADYAAYAEANRVLPVPDDFDMQSAALRYAVKHYLLPKIKNGAAVGFGFAGVGCWVCCGSAAA